MKLLSIADETHETLSRLRMKDEADNELIKRILEYARCYMVIRGAEEARAHVAPS